MTIKHVIIPIDFSEVSIAAVDHGRWLADRSTSTVELVAVTTPRYANVTTAALTSLATAPRFEGLLFWLPVVVVLARDGLTSPPRAA